MSRARLLQTKLMNVDENFNEVGKVIDQLTEGALDKRSYTFLGRRVFTRTGTYTLSKNCRAVLLRMVGGGGGGGGCSGSVGNFAFAGGGWSGEYLEKWVAPGALISGVGVTIGAGGAGGVSNTQGATGGDTVVELQGVKYRAKGGVGGLGMATGAGAAVTGVPARATGSTTGDFNYAGPPEQGLRISGGAGWSGAGGSNPLGSGGQTATTAGTQGLGYGAGGSGSQANASNTNGAPGTAGVVIIEEYM